MVDRSYRERIKIEEFYLLFGKRERCLRENTLCRVPESSLDVLDLLHAECAAHNFLFCSIRRVMLNFPRSLSTFHTNDRRTSTMAFRSSHEPVERSSIAVVSLDMIESDILRELLAIWNGRRAGRAMPSRRDFVPRAVGHLLQYVSLVRVLPERDNYEFRIIGDAHVQAYGTNDQGKCLSDVAKTSPDFGRALKKTLDAVVESLRPIAYGGAIGRDVGETRFVSFESLFLPLGDDESVDHIISAAVYVPRGGVWPQTFASG